MARRINIFALLIAFVLSCGDNDYVNDPIDNKKIDTTFYLNLEIGKTFLLENAQGQEMELKITQFQNNLWANSFWDTINKSSLQTWILRQKIFEGNFPRLEYFAIAETDSSYIFGAKKHRLINTEIPLEFYVPIFEIPFTPANDIYIRKHKSSYNGIEFTSLDSTSLTLDFQDSLKSIFVKTYAIRRNFREGVWEQQFLLENGKGFRKFWEYELTHFPE